VHKKVKQPTTRTATTISSHSLFASHAAASGVDGTDLWRFAMRKAGAGRVRGRVRRAQIPARPAPTGFGAADSSSSSSSAPPSPSVSAAPLAASSFSDAALAAESSRKRARTSGKSRIFQPAPLHDPFLEQLKKQQQHEHYGAPEAEPFVSTGPARGSFDLGDPLTTNLFVGNLVRIAPVSLLSSVRIPISSSVTVH
jgi:hypothetical protein